MKRAPVTVEDVNSVVEHAAINEMGQVLAYDSEPKVSIDFNHTTHSCIFAPDQTKVVGRHTVRVLAWNDNEWAFSCRMADVASTMGRLMQVLHKNLVFQCAFKCNFYIFLDDFYIDIITDVAMLALTFTYHLEGNNIDHSSSN